MTLQQPWWLVALPFALVIVYFVARQGRRVVPARQQQFAVWLRMIGVTLLVLALTQPLLVRSSARTLGAIPVGPVIVGDCGRQGGPGSLRRPRPWGCR